MMRRLLSVMVLWAVAGCGDDPAERASLFVAEHLVTVVPEEGRKPFLAPELQTLGSPELEPVPRRLLERMQEVTGLPVASDSMIQGRDTTMILLYLFRPLEARPDSMRMLGGWLGFTDGGGVTFWAYEYDYLMDCTSACRLLAPPGLEILN